MNRDDLKNLARIREHEASVLFQNECFDGAYYLAGYAIECALKACIARQVNQYDFPDKALTSKIYTHDLDSLLSVAGLKEQFKQDARDNSILGQNWAIVIGWKETTRYDYGATKETAEEMLNAIRDNQSRVMKWVRKFW